MNEKLMQKNGVTPDGFKPADRVGDLEGAVLEVADMVSNNEVSIEDLTSAVMELAEMIGG